MHRDPGRRAAHGVLDLGGADHRPADPTGVPAPALGPPLAADEEQLLAREPPTDLFTKAVAGRHGARQGARRRSSSRSSRRRSSSSISVRCRWSAMARWLDAPEADMTLA